MKFETRNLNFLFKRIKTVPTKTSNIVKRLLEQGSQAVVLDDLSSVYKENLLLEVKFI